MVVTGAAQGVGEATARAISAIAANGSGRLTRAIVDCVRRGPGGVAPAARFAPAPRASA